MSRWVSILCSLLILQYRFPAHEVKGAIKNRAARLGMHGMSLQIEGHHDLRFEFWNVLSREEVCRFSFIKY